MISTARNLFIETLFRLASWAQGSESSLLQSFLHRWPWWLGGHERIAEQALLRGDVLVAYASAQALRALAKNTKQLRTARRLNALCLMRAGKRAQAEVEFASLLVDDEDDVRTAEELAACYMERGAREDARQLLERFPLTTLSPEAQMALSSLQNVPQEGNGYGSH